HDDCPCSVVRFYQLASEWRGGLYQIIPISIDEPLAIGYVRTRNEQRRAVAIRSSLRLEDKLDGRELFSEGVHPFGLACGTEDRAVVLPVKWAGIFTGHDDDSLQPGIDVFVDYELDCRFVDDRQKLLRITYGYRQHSGARTSSGDDTGFNVH